MIPQHVTFIGGGNMARSLIGGLLANGIASTQIRVVDPNSEQRQQLAHLGVAVYAHAQDALPDSDMIIFAVKPQIMTEVAQSVAPFVQAHHPLVVSIAAGIRCDDLARWLGGGSIAIVRTMPNTPALVQSGATGLFANPHVSHNQRNQAESLMRAVGVTTWVHDEVHIDAVTAVSGSGPAYFFLMMEAMITAGESLGLDPKTAQLLTVQTALGAAKMAMESKLSPAMLRAQVTSPNGTTEQAINTFEQEGFQALVAQAMMAAYQRADALATQLGAQS